MTEQQYATLKNGGVWHIYRGDYRHDLLFPEPQAICGTVLPETETSMVMKRPTRWAMCMRCLAKEARS